MSNSYDDNGNKNGNKKTYDVGFKKPPKDTQFKPGQSGNKKGRPKTPNCLSEIYESIINEPLTIINKTTGKKERVIAKVAFVRQVVVKALAGDKAATRIILEWEKMFGKRSDEKGGGVLLIPVIGDGSVEDWAKRFERKGPPPASAFDENSTERYHDPDDEDDPVTT